MALRDKKTGHVLSVRACRREMKFGRFVAIGKLLDGFCPVHNEADCIETYLAAEHVAGWSLWSFRRWRNRRRGGA
jgi:hypothetical protein